MHFRDQAAVLKLGAEPGRRDRSGVERQRVPLQGHEQVIGGVRTRGEIQRETLCGVDMAVDQGGCVIQLDRGAVHARIGPGQAAGGFAVEIERVADAEPVGQHAVAGGRGR